MNQGSPHIVHIYMRECTYDIYTDVYITYLRLNKPSFLPAATIAGLELIRGIDSNTVVCVIQRGKVVPVGAKMNYWLDDSCD